MNRQNKACSIAITAFFAALTAICSQIQIPLPYIPINLALLAVHLSGALLGSRRAASAQIVYLLLGLIGLPVFAGFGAGPGILFEKTGGYILGYVLCALIDGRNKVTGVSVPSVPVMMLHMLAGTFVCYFFGTIWFMRLTRISLSVSLSYCVIPFIPGDIIKIILAAILARRLTPQLQRLGLC